MILRPTSTTRTSAVIVLALLAVAFRLEADELPEEVPLWPGDAPGAPRADENRETEERGGVFNVYTPTLRVFKPASETASARSAVVVLPGGGYGMLAVGWEGYPIAEWFNKQGVTAILVKYRVSSDPASGYQHPVPVADAQRALRTVRAHADAWEVDRGRIGVIGFSAGGHLAASVSNLWGETFFEPVDAIDHEDARPDYAVLVYPVISMRDGLTHVGSRKNLLGADAPGALAASLSMESRVTPRTPPTFLVHGTDDDVVSPLNSTAYYDACARNKVPVELHLFRNGPHGFTLGKEGTAVSAWPELLINWMRSQDFLPSGNDGGTKNETK